MTAENSPLIEHARWADELVQHSTGARAYTAQKEADAILDAGRQQ